MAAKKPRRTQRQIAEDRLEVVLRKIDANVSAQENYSRLLEQAVAHGQELERMRAHLASHPALNTEEPS